METYVIVKGDLIDYLAAQITEMDERGVLHHCIQGEDDITYSYSSEVGVTFVRFSGASWAMAAAGLVDYLQNQGIPFTIDGTKPAPFIVDRQPDDHIIQGKNGKLELPPLGNIRTIITYNLALKNQKRVVEAAEALAEMETRD